MTIPEPAPRDVYTTSSGAPVSEPYAAQRVGASGPLLIQDFHHIDLLAHFDRERIPERVVHAKGAGAHGYFVLNESLSDITSSKTFTETGKEHSVTIRFSTVGGEQGSADTARDPRGFAIKIRTEEGILDWVFNNTPVFFIRDPAKFPHFIHTQKRNPQTHLKDPDIFWDYITQNPESAHQVTILFSDRGTPDGYHNQHGYSGHTYKFVKDDGSWVYTKIHVRADKGFKTLDGATAGRLSGENPDYGIQALFEAIERKEYPSWTVSIQTMTPKQAEEFEYNILDLTKVWSHAKYPLREIGKIVLNKNVENYFAEVEQAAFSPSHTIPYFEPSADPVLQSRLFSYPDTHRHRLGVNYIQLPVNKPKNPVVNFQRDGFMAIDNQGSRPNYQSSFQPLSYVKNRGAIYGKPRDLGREGAHERWIGSAYWDLSEVTQQDFEQPHVLINKVLTPVEREHLVNNVVDHVRGVKSAALKENILTYWASIDQKTSNDIAKKLGLDPAQPFQDLPLRPTYSLRVRQDYQELGA